MRILFTTHPAYGHFHPMLSLATALRNAGHDVRFASGDRFGETIRATGFDSYPVGLDWLESDKSGMPDELRPAPGCTIEDYFTQQFVTATAASVALDIIALAETWKPHVIVRERTEFGGAIAADSLGVPVAAVQVGSSNLFTSALLRSIEPAYNIARTQVHLPADVGLGALESHIVLSAAPPQLHDPEVPSPHNLVALCPTALDRAADARLPDWTAELGLHRPLVYATLGTVFNNPAYELPLFPAVLAGLQDESMDLVITVGPNGDPTSLEPHPTNVRVERYLPQSLLFPRCSIVICHAGTGTLLAAIEHAVPIIAVPFGADQHINARSIERLGIGAIIDQDDLTPERIRNVVHSLLRDPTAKNNIARLRDSTHRLPTIDHAVHIVEHLAESSPTPT